MTSQTDRTPGPDSVREEAERLVAAGLAAVSMAADRVGAPTRERGGAAAAGFDALGDALFGPSAHRRHTVANNSEACCQCPVCRVIAAARRPDPQVAERIASGVGDLAEGAARLLRTVAGQPPAAPAAADPDDPWATATTADPADPANGPADPADPADPANGPADPADPAAER